MLFYVKSGALIYHFTEEYNWKKQPMNAGSYQISTFFHLQFVFTTEDVLIICWVRLVPQVDKKNSTLSSSPENKRCNFHASELLPNPLLTCSILQNPLTNLQVKKIGLISIILQVRKKNRVLNISKSSVMDLYVASHIIIASVISFSCVAAPSFYVCVIGADTNYNKAVLTWACQREKCNMRLFGELAYQSSCFVVSP